MIIAVLGKSLEELKNEDTSQIFENPDNMALIYRTPAFVHEVRRFLPVLLSEGYLD